MAKKKTSSKSAVKQQVSVGQKVLIVVGMVAGLGAIAAGAGSFDYEQYKRRRLYYKEQQMKKTMQQQNKTSQTKTAQTIQTAQKKVAYKRVYPGMLVKMQNLSTVYYIGADFKRYVITTEDVMKSWYIMKGGGFGNMITVIPNNQMSKIKLGGNVRIRPGSRPVKMSGNPKVYTISSGGVLHQIQSEDLATQLYGPKWNLKIAEIPLGFSPDYTEGDPITSKDSEYAPKTQLIENPTIDHDLGLK